MEEGSLHPSVIMKIQGQLPYNFYRIFCKFQALTRETCGAVLYVGGGGSPSSSNTNMHQSSQGNAFVGSASKGHNNNNTAFSFLSMVTTSVALTTAVAPVKRVMLLLQSQNEIIKSGRLSNAYKGIGDCFVRTVRNEGFTSLWRGNTASVLHFVSWKVQRIVMASFRTSFNQKKENDSLGDWFARNLGTAALAGGTTILLVYHLEYARTRLANDIKISTTNRVVTERQFNGLIDVYRKTLQSDGIVGLFRGFNLSCLQFFVNNMVMLGMYVVVKPKLLLQSLGLQQNLTANVLLPAGIAICCDLAMYPMDTVRGRMMMRSGEAIKYKSSIDAFSQILKNEGVKSLYKGASASVLLHAVVLGFLIVMGNTLSINVSPEKSKSGNQGGHQGSSVSIGWRNWPGQ
ncbi:hypothetical protein ACOSQ3_012221 [Xanthoceras sorbifolium]